MISDYNKYCPQGKIEAEYLINVHGVKDQDLCKLGMIWLRNFEKTKAYKRKGLKSTSKKVILYAGNSPNFFSNDSEICAIDRILKEIDSGKLQSIRLIYRPVGLNQNRIRKLKDKYKENELFEIQIPQVSMLGIEQKILNSSMYEIEEYAEQMGEADLLIMSAGTTMAFDALSMDIPCISNFTNSGRKRTNEYLTGDEFFIPAVSNGLRVVYTLDDLIDKIIVSIDDPGATLSVKKGVFDQWDYNNKEYAADFLMMIKSLLK